MGNRGGVLHNDQREIVRQCNGRRWITCLLNFKGIRREVMAPRRYTELFFLDEAVALAAGHRPCAECRRPRFDAFRKAWMQPDVFAPEMDVELHRARIDHHGGKVTYRAPLDSLPDGCFIHVEGASYLVQGAALLLWSAEGYRKKERRPGSLAVTVLTPEPTVQCLRRGYRPEVHESVLTL